MIASAHNRRVAAALSGGVDSAVAAALLVEEGVPLVAMTLRLRAGPPGPAVPSAAALDRARSVTQRLGIPFQVIDAHEAFQRDVIEYFVREYAAGRTPNPCVRCNRLIRFGLLIEKAIELGAPVLATGHYARIQQVDGAYRLLRGLDPSKDQSYFLHTLNQHQLAHARFPLGRLTKDEVRAIAHRLDLPVADQAESQDVCFLVEGDYREFLAQHAPHALKPGPILDADGRVLGEHRGLAAYTIGQRKGLNVAGPEPLYVLEIRPEANAIVVGTADELGRDGAVLHRVHYVSGRVPSHTFRAEAQIRYQAQPVLVTVSTLSGARADVQFDHPQRDITPGQSLVLYHGEVVLGGGTICEARSSVL